MAAAASPAFAGSERATSPAPAAGTLDLTGFSGAVRLVLATSDDVRVMTDGWQLGQRQGALFLEPRLRSRPADAPAGGSCGESSAATAAPAESATPVTPIVDIAIPPATRVVAGRFAGSLESAVALVEPRLDVGAGTLRLVQIVGGELSITGAGSATVGEAAGQLALSVDGAGTIDVRAGLTDQLKARLQGSGRIRHGGVVRRAFLAADGPGEIRVHQVHEPLRIDQAGGATITATCLGLSCTPQ